MLKNPYEHLTKRIGEKMTYEDFCKVIDEPIAKTKANKSYQLKQLRNYLEFDNSRGFITVTKIPDINVIYDLNDYKDGIWKHRQNIRVKDFRYNQFHINYKDRKKGGVYSITLNNIIYIGQTSNLIDRFNAHWTNCTKTQDKTYNLLQQGGILKPIYFSEDENIRTSIEQIEIQKYIQSNIWTCINQRIVDKNKPEKNLNKKNFSNINSFSLKKHNTPFTIVSFSTLDRHKIIKLLTDAKIEYYEWQRKK